MHAYRLIALFTFLFAYSYSTAQTLKLTPVFETTEAQNRVLAQLPLGDRSESLPTSYYAVQTSIDLQQWDTSYFRYNANTDAISQSDFSKVRIQETDTNQTELSVRISLPLNDKAFVRVGKLDTMPEGVRFLSRETYNLLQSLHRIADDPDHFAFGQEFPLSFTVTDNIGNNDLDESDVQQVVGDHPGVHGSDFLYLIDQPWHDSFHIEAVKKAYADGAIITFDWHWAGKYPIDGQAGYAPSPENNQILDFVARDDDSRGDVTWFYEEIDRVLELVNEELKIPFVFRPFHEMDGNWFWWGRQIDGGAETYRKAYQLMVDYMTERSDYILFCWSPDVAVEDFSQFYPGDEYVDVCGRDIYNIGSSGRPIAKLNEMIDFAEARGKVAVFSETGYTLNGSFETGDPDWWTTRILDPILADEKAGRIAWVLTWINASWSGPYVPHVNSPEAAKEDFTRFYQSPATLFQSEINALKIYEDPATQADPQP